MSRLIRCALTPLEAGDIMLDSAAARYLIRVRRLRVGQRFVAFDPQARTEAEATLTSADLKAPSCSISCVREASSTSALPVTLFQAIGKGDKAERVVRDATQLGAKQIVLVQTEHSVPRLSGKLESKHQRYAKVALESARQCGRGDVPSVEGLTSLASALAAAQKLSVKLAFDAQGELSVRAALEGGAPRGIAVLIGPEGGFSPKELESVTEAGFSLVSLGPFVLRTETAAVAALAVLAEYC